MRSVFRSLHPLGAVETVENGLILQRPQDPDRLDDGLQVKVTHGNQFACTLLAWGVMASPGEGEL